MVAIVCSMVGSLFSLLLVYVVDCVGRPTAYRESIVYHILHDVHFKLARHEIQTEKVGF